MIKKQSDQKAEHFDIYQHDKSYLRKQKSFLGRIYLTCSLTQTKGTGSMAYTATNHEEVTDICAITFG